MSHYVCQGECQGVADTPGVCQAEDCPQYQKPLLSCDCDGGKEAHEHVHDNEDQ